MGAELYCYVVVLPGHLQTMRNAVLVAPQLEDDTRDGRDALGRILPLIALSHSTTCSVDKSEGKTSL